MAGVGKGADCFDEGDVGVLKGADEVRMSLIVLFYVVIEGVMVGGSKVEYLSGSEIIEYLLCVCVISP